ncbi:MAG: NAD(P)H-dependent glycerol-3-phosphate dehydrogenase, partial [Fimbriimonadaceae bacterium]
MDVTVLGAGSWGTALAILLARNGHRVRVHGRNPSALRSLDRQHENIRYLPGFAVPREVEVVLDADALEPCDLWLVAVPAAGAREAFGQIRGESPVVGIASKGLESVTAKLLSEVAAEVIPDARIGAVSGPNLAVEIVRGIPTAAVAASPLEPVAEAIRRALMCRTYRVYLSDDLIGVELAGAVKNVLAIGAGISDGLGFGDNTKASLLARGLHEMTSLGLALGARLDTFLGVAGVGDLFA